MKNEKGSLKRNASYIESIEEFSDHSQDPFQFRTQTNPLLKQTQPILKSLLSTKSERLHVDEEIDEFSDEIEVVQRSDVRRELAEPLVVDDGNEDEPEMIEEEIEMLSNEPVPDYGADIEDFDNTDFTPPSSPYRWSARKPLRNVKLERASQSFSMSNSVTPSKLLHRATDSIERDREPEAPSVIDLVEDDAIEDDNANVKDDNANVKDDNANVNEACDDFRSMLSSPYVKTAAKKRLLHPALSRRPREPGTPQSQFTSKIEVSKSQNTQFTYLDAERKANLVKGGLARQLLHSIKQSESIFHCATVNVLVLASNLDVANHALCLCTCLVLIADSNDSIPQQPLPLSQAQPQDGVPQSVSASSASANSSASTSSVASNSKSQLCPFSHHEMVDVIFNLKNHSTANPDHAKSPEKSRAKEHASQFEPIAPGLLLEIHFNATILAAEKFRHFQNRLVLAHSFTVKGENVEIAEYLPLLQENQENLSIMENSHAEKYAHYFLSQSEVTNLDRTVVGLPVPVKPTLESLYLELTNCFCHSNATSLVATVIHVPLQTNATTVSSQASANSKLDVADFFATKVSSLYLSDRMAHASRSPIVLVLDVDLSALRSGTDTADGVLSPYDGASLLCELEVPSNLFDKWNPVLSGIGKQFQFSNLKNLSPTFLSSNNAIQSLLDALSQNHYNSAEPFLQDVTARPQQFPDTLGSSTKRAPRVKLTNSFDAQFIDLVPKEALREPAEPLTSYKKSQSIAVPKLKALETSTFREVVPIIISLPNPSPTANEISSTLNL